MRIEKDKILNLWVVWFIDGALIKEVYRSRLKKDCINFINKKKRGMKNAR